MTVWNAVALGMVLFTMGFSGCRTAPKTEWKGRCVVVFGDSISDPRYDLWKQWWKWVGEDLGSEMLAYAVDGREWDDVPRQVETMKVENRADVDAFIIFVGTNDFNQNVPLGNWWEEALETVNRNGRLVQVKRRSPLFDRHTLRGRINIAMNKLKSEYPDRQIVLLTPIRRGYFSCDTTNVQPEDSYSNELGLFIGDYAAVVQEAGTVWSVPVIDTYSESGLLPSMPSFSDCCNRPDADRLHPSTEGCRRLALTVSARLKSLPATFRK